MPEQESDCDRRGDGVDRERFYSKMQRLGTQMSPSNLALFSRRLLVATVCTFLGVIHGDWRPSPVQPRAATTFDARLGGTVARYVQATAMSCKSQVGWAAEVRTILPNEWGVPHPLGLAFASSRNQLVLVGVRRQQPSTVSHDHEINLLVITPDEAFVGAATLTLGATGGVDVAVDEEANVLYVLSGNGRTLAGYALDHDGLPREGGLALTDLSHVNYGQSNGIAVDVRGRQLLILDSASQQIIALDLDDLAGPAARIEVTGLGEAEFSAIAVHPDNGHLFVASSTGNTLYELVESGSVVRRYDLRQLELVDVQGMAFGPSTDSTDEANMKHLFIADGNSTKRIDGDSEVLYGSVMEVALLQSGIDAACMGDARHLPRRR